MYHFIRKCRLSARRSLFARRSYAHADYINYSHDGRASCELKLFDRTHDVFAIRTTVVPIILAIRKRYSLFARRSIEQCLGGEKIQSIYVILGYKFSLSCE